MKKFIVLLSSMLILASCTTPKYTYYFDHYDYNSGKKKVTAGVTEVQEQPVIEPVNDAQLIASTEKEAIYIAEEKPASAAVTKEEAVAKLKSLTKEERKELKKELKSYVKEVKNAEAAPAAKAGLENDVKLAAIFGAVGIVLLIIGGDVLSILGAVALLVGLYFFVRWLMRQ